MPVRQAIDITDLAVLGEQFPLRLMQLGFRLYQVIDTAGQDRYRYILPPVCEVSEGSFLMGSATTTWGFQTDKEIPQFESFLPAFLISVYPVTVAEYVCAVHARAVREPKAYDGISWHQQQQTPDHPVACITWHQATAYARWLAKVTKQSWRLPSEAEWEKAARGTQGWEYPWGNDFDRSRSNIAEKGNATAMPIGSYPSGASPYGVQDMIGNGQVWTSTRSTLHIDPIHKKKGREDIYYVQRGGKSVTGRSKCAAPMFHDEVGMRLALSKVAEVDESRRTL